MQIKAGLLVPDGTRGWHTTDQIRSRLLALVFTALHRVINFCAVNASGVALDVVADYDLDIRHVRLWVVSRHQCWQAANGVKCHAQGTGKVRDSLRPLRARDLIPQVGTPPS
ncbi:hypothetical protein ACFV9G_07700 [Nocardioides sp. NPDC059952]|uniref:hypothetical protein n=1 Tax=Nocardioides sp. NPDC059952 TaxID=3347014 RepID=UPI00364F80EE